MLKQPQVQLPVKHYFSPGVYARELTIYGGCIITGAVHKYEQLNILSSGTMRVLIEGEFRDVSAPFTVVSPPGTKRIAYAVTDCVWTTIFGTDLTDVEEIERNVACFTEEEYLEWHSQSQQLSLPLE
jgi:quercetin dioxygenase-like cupin family protein